MASIPEDKLESTDSNSPEQETVESQGTGNTEVEGTIQEENIGGERSEHANREEDNAKAQEQDKESVEDKADSRTVEKLLSQFKAFSNRDKAGENQEEPLTSIERLREAERNWGMRFSESSFQNPTFIINQGTNQDVKTTGLGENLLAVEDESEILKWCSEHYRDLCFSFFLAVCILDRQPYGKIDDMARELHQLFLPQVEEKDGIEESNRIYKTQMLKILGITEYLDFTKVRGVRLEVDFLRLPYPEQSVRYLQLLIKEFPEMRSVLCGYLTKKIIDVYRKNADYIIISGCSEALSVISAADLQFFNDQIIPQFLQRSSSGTDLCLAGVLKRIYHMDKCREYVVKCITQWGQLQNNPHCVLTSLYLCGMIGRQEFLVRDIWNIVLGQILNEISEQDESRRQRYFDILIELFESGSRNISYYKGVIHAFFDKLIQAERERDWGTLEGVSFIFLLFLMSDLGNKQDMLLVRIMGTLDQKTGKELSCLWAATLQNRQFPKEAWNVLECYLERYDTYDSQVIERIAFFFYWVNQALGNNQVDIFLKRCMAKNRKKTGLASDIYKRINRESRNG